jgi:dihydrofolate reductase
MTCEAQRARSFPGAPGGELAAAFEREGEITQWVVSVLPCLLGAGIPVVGKLPRLTTLASTDHVAFSSGAVQLGRRVARPHATTRA